MPVKPTYPGVYIEEIRGGARAIEGVATSITAFVGRAIQGPVDAPTLIDSYADFECQFGGLDLNYPMSYAVRDFFGNGGSKALVVRLFKATNEEKDGRARFTLAGDVELVAVSPGKWGEKLRVVADVELSDDVRSRLGLSDDDPIFNLTITAAGSVEQIREVTVATGSLRRVDRVLAEESNLIRWDGEFYTPALHRVEIARDALERLKAATNEGNPAEIQKARSHYDSARLDLTDDAGQAERLLAAASQAENLADMDQARKAMHDAEAAREAADSQGLTSVEDYLGSDEEKTGLHALDRADLFNLLCLPPDKHDGDTPTEVYRAAMEYCFERRAFLLVDPPLAWGEDRATAAASARSGLEDLGLSGEFARNAALYFPRVKETDPDGGKLDVLVPCGIVAGVISRTDASHGVWKAPAGIEATLHGAEGLQADLDAQETEEFNALGINCLRAFPEDGLAVWGARTLRGADSLADEYKYIPVRRLALFIEESLYRGTQWAVFEPNDEPLWHWIRANAGAFLHGLFQQGAFQGTTPRDAYFVKCGRETTTENDIERGILNIVVGFAPLRPAEFLIIRLQQWAGHTEGWRHSGSR